MHLSSFLNLQHNFAKTHSNKLIKPQNNEFGNKIIKKYYNKWGVKLLTFDSYQLFSNHLRGVGKRIAITRTIICKGKLVEGALFAKGKRPNQQRGKIRKQWNKKRM